MNGDGKCSLRPWSAGQKDEEPLTSQSVDQIKMPYQRKLQDGSYERNMILKKIYKDFGSFGMSYKNSYGMTYTKSSFPGPQKRSKAESLSRMAISAKYEPYKPSGTPRYSKIDKFIDNLNLACASLPKPMIEDFGRVRPHTVAALSPPQKEAMMINVLESKPSPTELNGEQLEDQAVSKEEHERSKSPLESGHVLVPTVTQNKVGASPEMGTCKNADERNLHCERQITKLGSHRDAFESKKMEVVRAATMLQSRYRGYKVRRSQPLKYMLIIGNARSKLEELKQQLNTWKIADWFPTDYPERLAMRENVMNLLMELDSIQGVPLYIREFRKNVRRDVIKFQEEVDVFVRHNVKQGGLFDLAGNENMGRPKSRTERRTVNRNVIESASSNETPNSGIKQEHSINPQSESGPVEELAGGLISAARGESDECESENNVQSDELKAEIIAPMCPEEIVQPREENLRFGPQPSVVLEEDSNPQSSVELAVGAEHYIRHDESGHPQSLGPRTCDIYIPLREDISRNSRKKRYGVRFEDDVNQKKVYALIQPCSFTEQSLESSSHDAGNAKSDDQYFVASSCSAEIGQRELTDSNEYCDKVHPNASAAMPVAQKLVCLKTDVGGGTESWKGKDQPGCLGTLFEQAPATQPSTVTVHVHSSESLGSETSGYMEEPSYLDSNGDLNVRGRMKFPHLMADTRNPLANRFGGFGSVTVPSKSRFHNEQSHLRTSPPDGSIRPAESPVNYEGSCNSSDGAISETSKVLEGMEEDHGSKYEGFHSEAQLMKAPTLSLEQKKMVSCAGDETEIGPILGSPRLRRSCEDFQSVCLNPGKAVDGRTSNAEADIESDVEIDGVPVVEQVSCCSDCSRPRGHYPFECWRPRNVRTGEEELRLRHPCAEYPGEVREEYVPFGYKDAGCRDDYLRRPERAEFSGFDHRELQYVADPYTLKLRRARQAAQGRTANNDYMFHEKDKSCRPLPKVPTAVQHAMRAHVHKGTSYTPSPPESICSEAEKSYRRSKSHSPSRQIAASDDRSSWETDEGQVPDNELLLTKLVDDNNRLKGLLKDVMNWNKAQATAMVSMSERIEHLEGLNKLP